MTEQTPYLDEKTYHSERTLLVDIERRSAEQHDKAILTWTAGALGISITFINKIAPSPIPESLKWIGMSWLCLMLALVFIVGSFLSSQKACRQRLAQWDEEFAKQREPIDLAETWSTITMWLNRASYFFFVLGIGLLAVFSWINLTGE